LSHFNGSLRPSLLHCMVAYHGRFAPGILFSAATQAPKVRTEHT
jgi:hypothetical protein